MGKILNLLVSTSFITVNVGFDFSVDVVVSLNVSLALGFNSALGILDALEQSVEADVTGGHPFEVESAVLDGDFEHLNANEVTVLFEVSLTIFDSLEVDGADLAENRVFSSFTDALDGLVSSSIEFSVVEVDLHLGGNPLSSVVVGVSDFLFSLSVVSADNVSHLHALGKSALASDDGSLDVTLGLAEGLESVVNSDLESSAPGSPESDDSQKSELTGLELELAPASLCLSVLTQVHLDLSGPVFEGHVHVDEIKSGEVVLKVIPDGVTLRANSVVSADLTESTIFS